MTSHVFETLPTAEPWPERLGPGAVLLHGFTLAQAPTLMEGVIRIAEWAPFRQMITPSGHRMTVAMTHWESAHDQVVVAFRNSVQFAAKILPTLNLGRTKILLRSGGRSPWEHPGPNPPSG